MLRHKFVRIYLKSKQGIKYQIPVVKPKKLLILFFNDYRSHEIHMVLRLTSFQNII